MEKVSYSTIGVVPVGFFHCLLIEEQTQYSQTNIKS